mmetsp:Transcript_27883/g.81879  ORF Transcript_27883/g.81879 Transcript_27883/m.81879 type:complete len:302 (+) Transcript_27883:1513-2418(+)
MEGVIPAEAVLLGRKEAVALDHDEGVRRLHGEDEVVVILRAANVGELDSRLDHTAGGVAVKRQDAGGEGAMVGSDAHRAVERLALFHKGKHRLDEVLPLLHIVVLGLIDLLLEVLPTVGEVAGVDPDLLDGVGDELGDDWLEVHVGAEGDVIPLLEETLADLGASVRLALALDGDANEVEALVGAPHHLIDGCVDIGGGGGGHGLADDRVLRTELDRAAFDGAGLTAEDRVEVLTVLVNRAQLLIAGARFDRRRPKNVFRRSRVRRLFAAKIMRRKCCRQKYASFVRGKVPSDFGPSIASA